MNPFQRNFGGNAGQWYQQQSRPIGLMSQNQMPQMNLGLGNNMQGMGNIQQLMEQAQLQNQQRQRVQPYTPPQFGPSPVPEQQPQQANFQAQQRFNNFSPFWQKQMQNLGFFSDQQTHKQRLSGPEYHQLLDSYL